MKSAVLFGVLCIAAVEAGQPRLLYTHYKAPEGCYGNCPLPSYYPNYQFIPVQGKHYLPGYLPQVPALYPGATVVAPLAAVQVPAQTVSATAQLTPVANQVAEMPLFPAGPVAAVRFTGNGDFTAEGTGSSFFAGDGVANFNGQFPIGFFAGQGEAQFNGAGQIQVATVPGMGAVGTFENFQGAGAFEGQGMVGAFGTGQVGASGTGVAEFIGRGNVGINGIGQTNINAPLLF